jgi:hypothetical protein
MASRVEIINGNVAETSDKGIVYTKKCGWIDLGHARPKGAKELWDMVHYEKGKKINIEVNNSSLHKTKGYQKEKPPSHIVMYAQIMSKHGFKVGFGKLFLVKKGLSLPQKRAVALAIFLNVSIGFETYQGSWPYCWFTDSGFSGEDLVSDLIGFYRAVYPYRKYLELCEPVSKKKALEIWDKAGPIGSHKNRTIRPLLFNGRSLVPGDLPPFLTTIKPAKPGYSYQEYSIF